MDNGQSEFVQHQMMHNLASEGITITVGREDRVELRGKINAGPLPPERTSIEPSQVQSWTSPNLVLGQRLFLGPKWRSPGRLTIGKLRREHNGHRHPGHPTTLLPRRHANLIPALRPCLPQEKLGPPLAMMTSPA